MEVERQLPIQCEVRFLCLGGWNPIKYGVSIVQKLKDFVATQIAGRRALGFMIHALMLDDNDCESLIKRTQDLRAGDEKTLAVYHT